MSAPSYIGFEAYTEHIPASIPSAVQQVTARFAVGCTARVAKLPQFEQLRQTASDIRLHTIENMDAYLTRLEEKVTAAGGHVHWARTAEDARQIVLQIAREHHVKTGTLVLRSSAEKPRAVSLLPRIRLAIVQPEMLAPTCTRFLPNISVGASRWLAPTPGLSRLHHRPQPHRRYRTNGDTWRAWTQKPACMDAGQIALPHPTAPLSASPVNPRKKCRVDSSLPLVFRIEILSLTLVAWLAIYFFFNRTPAVSKPRLDLGTVYDQKIPFLPHFALLYFSTYIFVAQPFLFIANKQIFYLTLFSFIAITIFSTLIHALLPSKITRHENLEVNNPSIWMLNLFQKVCKPHGNFPSMHVGLSVPVVAANFMTFGWQAGVITLVWAILIALSTLFAKQHYIIDVVAGALGGAIIYALVFLFFALR